MKGNLSKSHDAMLRFLEERIKESDKWPGKTPSVQKNYNKAKRLVARAHAARVSLSHSSRHRGGE